MAVPSNTYKTYESVGNREELSDIISNISPTDTPFMTMIGKRKVVSTKPEWTIDSLAAASTANAQLEGDDAAPVAADPTVRVGSNTQISSKTISVSGTQEVIDKAGRKSEMAYQIAKRGKELKRDQEAIMTSNQIPSAGAAGTARKLRPLCGWYATNAQRGAGGANGSATTAATDGTQRAFTETLLKQGLQDAYTAGGNPSTVMMSPAKKVIASGFTGNATRTIDAGDKEIQSAVDVYASDFGKVSFVINRFQRDRDVHILDKDLWAMGTLRPYNIFDLAKTGDSTKKEMLTEYTLMSLNEAGNAIIADLL